MPYRITVLPQKQNIEAEAGQNLLQVLRAAGMVLQAPCGGNGRCGKCRVLIDDSWSLACRRMVDRDMVVTLPAAQQRQILTDGVAIQGEFSPLQEGFLLCFDIGTTTVAGYLLDKEGGQQLSCESAPNPQAAFGADVISRIQAALSGEMPELTNKIRLCVEEMACRLCRNVGITPEAVGTVSVVGNPAMQQLFLGICPENLAKIPFAPVLTQPKTARAAAYIPVLKNAQLLIVPDISGYVGADTLAGVLATGMAESEEMTLLVDIGTNGEMVLGNRFGMLACSTAAGPALEGANIRFGMGGGEGAIDHVWTEDGKLQCSVIGEGEAVGICGSGLIDAVAAALELGLLNSRGRILNEDCRIDLTDRIFLTQEDIRQVQMAKGAIAAGIELLSQEMGIRLEQICRVYLAGAFGTYMNPQAACRMGLLPMELADRITVVGNAAGSGAKQMACSAADFYRTAHLLEQIRPVELARLSVFSKTFAKQMGFDTMR